MSVFTTVTADELDVWLQQYPIGALSELQGIASGIENTNYFVTTTRGRYVLTLFEKLKPHELPFYLDLMAHLADRSIPCPHPVATHARAYLGELKGKPAALVTRLTGKDLEHPDAGHCAQVGELLARIHLAGASYPARMENPRGPKWWSAAAPEILPFLDADEARLLREELAWQAAAPAAALPTGAIHADLFRDNVLFEHDRITGVIDFYFACTDALAYDLAIAVNDWCLAADGGFDATRTEALLGAYAALRPHTAPEHAAWPALLRAAALRFWVSRLYDLHLPRPGALTHAKDPAHFRDLLRHHAARGRELPRLVS